MRKLTRVELVVLVGLTVGCAVYCWLGPTVFRQLRRMRVAREHAPVVEALLREDPAFDHIRVGAGSGGGGTFLVVGCVASREDLQRLRSLVDRTQPPVDVVLLVQVQ